jgi:hypothetical protein
MVCLTQPEIDALWPHNKRAYVFVSSVTIPGAQTISAAAQELQKLYEGRDRVFGEFNVEPENPNLTGEHPMFLVTFTRDVATDRDVVNPVLSEGHDLLSVLRNQFSQEFDDIVERRKLDFKLDFLSLPEFING